MLPEGALAGRVVVVTRRRHRAREGDGARAVAPRRCGRGRRPPPRPARADGRRLSGPGLAAPVDDREPEAVAAAFDAAEEALGPVTPLVNNAAGNFVVNAENISPNGWRAAVGIVLDGTFFCSRGLALRVIRRGSGGQIVNMVATYAWTGGPGTVHSAAAKAGVVSLTRTLAVEWAPHRIRVNALAPGSSIPRRRASSCGRTTTCAGRSWLTCP